VLSGGKSWTRRGGEDVCEEQNTGLFRVVRYVGEAFKRSYKKERIQIGQD
jgi:hypothetical protein